MRRTGGLQQPGTVMCFKGCAIQSYVQCGMIFDINKNWNNKTI
jgi:hypothetical protein